MLRAPRKGAIVHTGPGASCCPERRDLSRRRAIDAGCHDEHEQRARRGHGHQCHDCKDDPSCHVRHPPILLRRQPVAMDTARVHGVGLAMHTALQRQRRMDLGSAARRGRQFEPHGRAVLDVWKGARTVARRW